MTKQTFFRSDFYVHRFAVVALLMSILVAASCSKDKDNDNTTPAAPAAVTFTAPNFYPESMQYDAAGGRFLFGSLTTGNIGQAKDDGTFSVFASGTNAAGTRFIASSVGITLDAPRNRVLVASSNLTTGDVARLVSFNLANGQLISDVNLGAVRPAAKHFASDAAVDAQGNAYVTDSFAPVIYKVDPQGVATVFLDDPQLGAPAGSFGINGIVFNPDGYLLITKTNDGTLFKVPISNPAGFTRVTTTNINLLGVDGLLLQDKNTLQGVSNSQNKVYRLSSTDNWATATVTGTFATLAQFPTALAARTGADSYVLYADLGKLAQVPPVATFTIGKVTF